MNVVIMTPAITKGDAVSNDVLGMGDLLENEGHQVYYAVRYETPDVPIVPLEQVKKILADRDDLLIYHHSIGCAEAIEVFEQVRCRRIVKYHNVTPPEFFRSINREIARGCAEGQIQVDRLVGDDVDFWVDSDFNGKDMQIRHPNKIYHVITPFNQVDQLMDAEPELKCIHLYDDWLTNILVVGRIAPNKNIELAIESFAYYCTHYNRDARLILIGDLMSNKYCEMILDRIRNLGIAERVIITGKVSLEQLKSFYLSAQMLLTTSKHEGCCLPLIEAMGLQVPIVAVPNAAIPGTAGQAGWFANESPEEIASVMHQAMTDTALREEKLFAGYQRYLQEFTNDAIRQRFLGLFTLAIHRKYHFLNY